MVLLIKYFFLFFSRDNATSGRISRQGVESHALTAANLIDAIITHQINQSNDGTGHPSNNTPINNQAHIQQQRAGDKLFQVSVLMFILTTYIILYFYIFM